MYYPLLKKLSATSLLMSLTVFIAAIPVVLDSGSMVAQATETNRKQINPSSEAKLIEAELLLFQGLQQFSISQFREALQAWKQSLALYREVDVREAFPQESRDGESAALGNLGTAYLSLGQYQEAIAFFEQGLVITREIGDRIGEGRSLNNLGEAYRELEQYQQAIDNYEQSLVILREMGDRAGEGTALGNLGIIYNQLGQYQQGIMLIEQDLSIAREIGNRFREGRALGNLGAAYKKLEQYQQAIDLSEQSLAIARESNDPTGEQAALINLGTAYRHLGQYQQAIELLEQSLTIARGISDRVGERRSLLGLAIAYRDLGEEQKAIDLLEQNPSIIRDIGDRTEERVFLVNLGNTYLKSSQYRQAISLYEQALVLVRELDIPSEESTILNNLGVAYNYLGQYQKVVDLQKQGLAISREIGDLDGESQALNGLGEAYRGLGQYRQAIDLYEQSLTITRELIATSGMSENLRGREGTTLGNLGKAYLSLGQYQEAIAFMEQDLAITREIGDRADEGLVLGNLAQVYNTLGQYQEAIEFSKQGLLLTRESGDRAGEGNALGNLGNAYRMLGQYQQAIDSYKQVLRITREIGDRAGEGQALGSLGKVYTDLEQYQKALSSYQQALVIHQTLGNKTLEGSWLRNIGRLLVQQNRPELAIIFYKQFVNGREKIREGIQGLSQEQQQLFAEMLVDDYRALANLLLQQDRVLEAQEVLDLLKLQELDDLKLQVRGNEETAQGLDLWPAEQEIIDRYYQLIQQDPEADFEAFINSPEIQSRIEKLRRNAQGQNLNPEQLEKLQDNLQQVGNAALLYPLVLDDRLELILVTTAGISRHTINIDRMQLNQAIADFRLRLTTPARSPKVQAQQLYEWLIAPIASELDQAGADTILYAADGQLRYIPLAALHDGNQWLTQRYTINHITAASLTDFSRDDNQSPSNSLNILAGAFSDTNTTHTFTIGDTPFRFKGLPYAGVEVDAIANTVPKTQAFFDQDFSRANIEPDMGNHSIVHFATHAEFVPGLPHESFILFGNGDRVSLRDISDWKLPNTDLVVLSACRTAVSGELGGGEEILGFGYQIQRTGARAAIASLWYVNDGGTQTLMDAFYTALINGYTKTEALCRAQLDLIHNNASVLEPSKRDIDIEWTDAAPPLDVSNQDLQGALNHPYYWAPFILIGNGL